MIVALVTCKLFDTTMNPHMAGYMITSHFSHTYFTVNLTIPSHCFNFLNVNEELLYIADLLWSMKVCLRTTGLAAGVTSLSSGNSTTEYFHASTVNLYSQKQMPAVKSLNPTLLIKSSGQTLTSSGGWCSTKFSISKYNYNFFLFSTKKNGYSIILYLSNPIQ